MIDTCADFRDRWPLGPHPAPAGDELAAHRENCPACQRWVAQWERIDAALASRPRVEPRPLWTESVVRAVQRDLQVRQRRRRRALSGMAAGVAAAVIVTWGVGRIPPDDAPVTSARTVVLAEELAEARGAVAGLGRRAADATVPAWSPPPWPALAIAGPSPLEPAAQSLGTAKDGLAAGFQPVTSSTRRAARLFWQPTAPKKTP